MKKLKVFLGLFVCALMVVPFSGVSASTKYDYASWQAPEDYGTVTKVNDNVTNIKGNPTESEPGMYYGAYSMKSEAKLADGINEEVYIELNKDSMANGELFGLSMSLNDSADGYVTELLVDTQKVNDGYRVTVGLDPDFSATITEDGVYTYRYNATIEDGKTYFQFSILKWDEVIASTKKIDMGETTAESAGYMWFCSITAANGLNVYTELPEKPATEEPTTPENPEKNPEEDKTEEEVKDEVENPKTSDGIMITFGTLAVSIVTVAIARKKLA